MPNKMERFTQRARRVLSLAQEEAVRLQHSYIGTEHILLGLMRWGGDTFLGKATISKKDDATKGGIVFKVLAQEVQTFPKEAVEPFGEAGGPADERVTDLGVDGLRTERDRPDVSDDQDE